MASPSDINARVDVLTNAWNDLNNAAGVTTLAPALKDPAQVNALQAAFTRFREWRDSLDAGRVLTAAPLVISAELADQQAAFNAQRAVVSSALPGKLLPASVTENKPYDWVQALVHTAEVVAFAGVAVAAAYVFGKVRSRGN